MFSGIGLALGLAALTAAPGCAPAKIPLHIELRDAASASPVIGCRVFAETPSKDHPFSIASILGQTGPAASNATTDARGAAILTGLTGRAVRLVVWPTGEGPRCLLLDDAQAAEGTSWCDVAGTPGSAEPLFQLRVLKPSENR